MNGRQTGREFPFLGERYVVEAFLGEGGVGRVYRARDRQLRRTVAIKTLRSRDADVVARFRHEAQSQARLDHEHICRVYEVGEADDGPFIVMQFIEGKSLSALGADLDLEEKVTLMEQIARAVQEAHECGVVHCDLKPANIMVERRPGGELHAHVLDFGIARSVGDLSDDVEAATSGTPAYMAPEHIRGDPAGQLADVYGLGATAYGVFAEQTPYYAATRAEVKQKILFEAPLRLGLVVPGIPQDLETIVTIAMSGEPRRRYPSAGAFADDLGRWSRGEPIRAVASRPSHRFGAWLWLRRKQAVVLLLLLASTVLAVGTALRLGQQVERRQMLITEYQTEVERIDRLLRRARMMPLHDTTAAEASARRRLRHVEATLLEYGPLARGPAYYALGFGHLMLREFDDAEQWLRAAVDSNFTDPEVESALGIAIAMQILDQRRGLGPVGSERVAEAVRDLSARGPQTAGRDHFHEALALFIKDDLDEALEMSRQSAEVTPWLYEALELEGDILMARSRRESDKGAIEAAVRDLLRAGDAYAEGLAVARSDPWLYQAETERLIRLIELEQVDGKAETTLLRRMVIAVSSAATAHPVKVGPLLGECRRVLEHARGLDPQRSELADLERRVRLLISESRGADGG